MTDKNENIYTVISTPNIALVKYWGKRKPQQLNLPNNSSVSMTLSSDALKTKTSVALNPNSKDDEVYINGVMQQRNSSEKTNFIFNIIEEMRGLSKYNNKLLVVSENSFPTGSGLASSASGAAALVFALNTALKLNLSTRELSIISRKISGSACRSVIGGFVFWEKGLKEDGSDSYARQIVQTDYWDLVDIIGIIDSNTKKVSSSEGHALTSKTSSLYKERIKFAESNALIAEKAIKDKDFSTLSEVIMRDSNNMHATMLDTWPPIRYITDKSWDALQAILELNKSHGENIAAYTFDAGPNIHVITEQKHSIEVKKLITELLGDENKIIFSKIGNGPTIINDGALIGESLTPII